MPPARRFRARMPLRRLTPITALLATACGATSIATASSSAPSASARAHAVAHTAPLFTLQPTPSPLPSLTPMSVAPSLIPAATPVTTSPDPISLFHAAPLPTIGGCTVFPANSPWNTPIIDAPVDPNSAAYISRIDSFRQFLHPDFGSNPSYGIPYSVVPASQPMVPVTFDAYGSESDPGPYPVPVTAPVESGSDHHVLTLDSGTCTLYEMYDARVSGNGWVAASGAVFHLDSAALRPDGWTSADAAGLPILPGLVTYDEVAAGAIDHALRFTVDQTQNGFIHPATHQAGVKNPNDPPMGLRLRLKDSFDLSHFHGESLVILEALKTYGMFVADNGSSWYVSGATDPRWNDTDLDQLKTVPGSAFEVVDTGPILRG